MYIIYIKYKFIYIYIHTHTYIHIHVYVFVYGMIIGIGTMGNYGCQISSQNCLSVLLKTFMKNTA